MMSSIDRCAFNHQHSSSSEVVMCLLSHNKVFPLIVVAIELALIYYYQYTSPTSQKGSISTAPNADHALLPFGAETIHLWLPIAWHTVCVTVDPNTVRQQAYWLAPAGIGDGHKSVYSCSQNSQLSIPLYTIKIIPRIRCRLSRIC